MLMLSNIEKFSLAALLLVIAFLWIIFRSVFVLIPTVIILSVIGWMLLGKKIEEKKKSEPFQVTVTCDLGTIVRTGKQLKVPLIVGLQDKNGNSVPASYDTEVRLNSKRGLILKPVVTLSKGSYREESVWTLTKDGEGDATVYAGAGGLNGGSIRMWQFCMFSGAPLPFWTEICPHCGKNQTSTGKEKQCTKCQCLISSVAHYCPICGACQTKK